MPLFDFECSKCDHVTEEQHGMANIPKFSTCEVCGARTSKVFSVPNFTCHGDDLDRGNPTYCPGLARKMPYGKNDPKAYFSSKYKAREAARKKADKDGMDLHLD